MLRFPNIIKQKSLISLFVIYAAVAVVFSIILQLSGILTREELQTINRRFEARPWLVWSQQSLKRLNLPLLLRYHEEHEIPKQWWAWDYTLSWLLENNHPAVKHNIIIFNHLIEDEPPQEAIRQFPWMEPLLSYPLSRKTVAKMVEFLAQAGAALIILDNDFPQYSKEDKDLAEVIHKCSTGKFGKVIPVLMVRTINRRSSGHLLQLEVPTSPSGVLLQLSKLDKNCDVESKYTGTTCVEHDEDQVVRRILTRMTGPSGQTHESIILKALTNLHEPIPQDVPNTMDIDFACPPNSELYPVRPFNYLLDPDQRKALLNPLALSADVNIKNAIVLLGDGVTDIHSTPFTNEGINQMSGTEILVHALETVSRHSWPKRLEDIDSFVYLVLASFVGGLVWIIWKSLQQTTSGSLKALQSASRVRLLADLSVFILIIAGVYFAACLIFAWQNIIVPVAVPMLALGLGTLAAILWELEHEREETFIVRLKAAQEKLTLTQEKYELELKRQEAEAQAREILIDKRRRHEFVRRINHDLNGPISVLNWTVSELQFMHLEPPPAKEKVARLVKSSDKLCELIDQLVQSYDYEVPSQDTASGLSTAVFDLSNLISDSLDGQFPLASVNKAHLKWSKPEEELLVKVNKLELSRIIDNLVRNAIKHNPEGTTVTVSVESRGDFHTLSVLDDGKGIAAEHLERIFEPGFRVDSQATKGQGLGLDIAKTLVEGMEGTISVSSELGKGTTFKIKLPAYIKNEPPETTKPRNIKRNNGQGKFFKMKKSKDNYEDIKSAQSKSKALNKTKTGNNRKVGESGEYHA